MAYGLRSSWTATTKFDTLFLSTMPQDPNFPKDLDIKPLGAPNTRYGAVTTFEEEFGLQAQQDAISTYGIAGRVW
jgi:hypothetical protein